MYFQRKKLGIKVCRLKIGFVSEGAQVKIIKKDLVGVQMNTEQADKYVRSTYGQGYALLSYVNDVVYVNLNLAKIYKEHVMEEHKHE